MPSCTVSSIARLVYAIDFVSGQYGILADDLDCEPPYPCLVPINTLQLPRCI